MASHIVIPESPVGDAVIKAGMGGGRRPKRIRSVPWSPRCASKSSPNHRSECERGPDAAVWRAEVLTVRLP